ncbi:pancreatic lipase-related protein 2-like [Pectinophora gossypiella]|uniref:Lipase domain-containing protein n=2 Tax=Pectinophora gossypiella TaxID=13191 RepID=A0A1E1W0R7_PECGO|nr:pancreatic lipase-related protein 2-like [Pectinophora gossypiella]
MGKVLFVCLAAVFIVSCSCDGAEIGALATRRGEFNMYYVYSRDNPHLPTRVYPTVQSANIDARDFRSMVVVLVHDHGGSHGTALDNYVKFALLSTEDVTIIVVDWSLVASMSYANAVAQAPSVGENIAQLLQVLVQRRRVTLANLHMVGFGLGAHIVALAARSVNGVVARITGLDPSKPQGVLNHAYLRPGDAAYVEVIHTDGEGEDANDIGIPIGNVDFFPNWGTNQPGCTDNACNHIRSYELFAASISDGNLFGRLCRLNVEPSLENCPGSRLALGTNTLIKYNAGSFFLQTGSTYPYDELD